MRPATEPWAQPGYFDVARRYRWGPLLYLGAFALALAHGVFGLAAYLALAGFYLRPGASDVAAPRPGRQ